MPRQHIGSGNSIEIPIQKRSVQMCGTRKRWWGAPGNRVSHMTVARKRGTCKDQFGHGANTGISYNTSQAFVHGVVPAVIPSKGAFSERFRFVEEVVVHVRFR